MKKPLYKKLIIAAVITIVLLVIILVVLVFDSKRETFYSVTIDNADAVLADVPDQVVSELEDNIYERLAIINGSTVNLPLTGAKVREDSIHSFITEDGRVYSDFIVDIESVKQSFLVQISYIELADKKSSECELENEKSRAVFYCLSDKEKIIYPESSCETNSTLPDEDTRYLLVPRISFILDDEKEAIASFGVNKTVNMFVDGCANIESGFVVEKAKDWVKSLGLPVQDFSFNILKTYDNCLIK